VTAAAWQALAGAARVAGFDERSLERVRRYLVRCPGAPFRLEGDAIHVAPLQGVEVIFHANARPRTALVLECPHYDPLPRSKRCASFAAGGGCRRPDARSCPEWLRCVLDDAGAPEGGAR
jgi:hypothetical protein